jgi:hypothetical protein
LKWRGVDLPRFTTVKMLGRIIKRPAVHIGLRPFVTDNPPHLSLFYFPRAEHHGRESLSLIWLGQISLPRLGSVQSLASVFIRDLLDSITRDGFCASGKLDGPPALVPMPCQVDERVGQRLQSPVLKVKVRVVLLIFG